MRPQSRARDARLPVPLALPALVLLDLDGTLVDSAPDVARCVDGALGDLGLPPRGEAQVRLWMGDGAERLLARALTGRMDGEPEPERLAEALARFLERYARRPCEQSRLYAGARAGLDLLHARGIPLACITNKPARCTAAVLRGLGLEGDFRLVVSGDTLPRRKPDPLPLRHAAREMGTGAAGVLLVGDSATDVDAARAAGAGVVCVSYGYNHGRDIRQARPDAVIDSLEELRNLLPRPGRD